MYDLSSGPNHCLLNTSYSSESQWQSSCIILFGENVCNCPNFVYLLFNHQHTVLIKWQILAVYSCLVGFHGWVLLGLRRVSVHQVAYRVLGNCMYFQVKLCVYYAWLKEVRIIYTDLLINQQVTHMELKCYFLWGIICFIILACYTSLDIVTTMDKSRRLDERVWDQLPLNLSWSYGVSAICGKIVWGGIFLS